MDKTIGQKFKSNIQYIILAFLVILFFRQCNINRDIDSIRMDIDSICNVQKEFLFFVDSINLLSKEDINIEMKKVMFEFLIYEDDFDHKRISLSEIKGKIEGNK